MAQAEPVPRTENGGLLSVLTTGVGRIVVSVAVPIIAFLVLWQGFLFLRDSEAPKGVIAVVAIVWGVGGVAAIYLIANWLIEKLPSAAKGRVLPFLFVGPAVAILAWYLLIPTIRTLVYSFQGPNSENFVGLDNYIFAFTNSGMLEAIRNNVLWLVIGTGFTTFFGLLVAILAEHSRFGTIAKALIFLPMAISFVGSSIIWRLVYAVSPSGTPQIGLLNGILTAFGVNPQPWVQLQPWNNFFLIVILVWSQAGFAMVILSAALRGVPDELREAARIDGASEFQVYTRIVIPTIRPTIITVATTIAILTLKIYDIVRTMTNGNFGTDVIATLQFNQMFRFFDYGKGAALAVILVIAVLPVIWYNLRQFGQRETIR
jgi:alpha-glucoside transport system permease protein